MTDRAAMQMALDAMVSFEGGTNGLYQGEFADEITALRAALEQPEQEPVAWMDRDGDLYRMPVIENWSPPHTLLYASPPQRKPLTDAEIWEIHDACIPPTEGYVSPVEFARAIEQAHGIKEKP